MTEEPNDNINGGKSSSISAQGIQWNFLVEQFGVLGNQETIVIVIGASVFQFHNFDEYPHQSYEIDIWRHQLSVLLASHRCSPLLPLLFS